MLYNPQRVTEAGIIAPNSVFYADPRDVFIHGLLQKEHKGTCASLPVLVIAVGRNLGYPLALVSTQNHLFVRWNDPNQQLNIEATSLGMNSYPDSYYRQWPYPIDEKTEKESGYLQVMSAAEETAVFFSLRGFCLMEQRRYDDAIKAHENAEKLAPHALHYQKILEIAKAEVLARRNARETQRSKLPPHPMFQDPNVSPEVNWIMWEQHERARLAHQNEERNRQQNQPWLHGITPPTPTAPFPHQRNPALPNHQPQTFIPQP